jgi:neurofibromin 1
LEEYEEGLGIARMQHDANMACLRTVVKLLDGLRLQALDGSSGDDANHVVSRRFNRYQTLLLAALKNWQFDNMVRLSSH